MELTKEQIRRIKAEFGPIFYAHTGDQKLLCRTITCAEAAEIGFLEASLLSDETAEAVFRLSVIDPDNVDEILDNIDLGTFNTVVESCLSKSGFIDEASLAKALKDARDRRTMFDDVYDVILCAFPLADPLVLSEMTIDKLMDLLIHAENVLKLKGIANAGQMADVDFSMDKGDGGEESEGSAEEEELARTLHEGAQQAAQEYL